MLRSAYDQKNRKRDFSLSIFELDSKTLWLHIQILISHGNGSDLNQLFTPISMFWKYNSNPLSGTFACKLWVHLMVEFKNIM